MTQAVLQPTGAPPAPRRRALAAAALRAIWFVVVPALLAVLALRYLLPSPVRAPEGALRELSRWVEGQELPLAVGLFLLFSALLRYWRSRLPAAELWAFEAAPQPAGLRANLVWGGLVVLAVAAAVVFRGSLFQSYRVVSGSMLPSLSPGDVLLSTQYAYGARLPGGAPGAAKAPRRGDIVVFRSPPGLGPEVPEELVKRVVGLPGDTVATRAGFVTINGWPVPTCTVAPYVFISGESMLEGFVRMEFLDDRAYLTVHGTPAPDERRAPYTVRPGEVFVLGDNRNNSSDSRAWNDGRGGGLRFEDIHGRIDRFLFGGRRNGGWDTRRLLETVGPRIYLEGVDDTELRAGIEHCLTQRPEQTTPPKAGAKPEKAP